MFLSRVMKDTSSHLTSLKHTIRQHFFPALTGRQPPGDLERELFALPARHGGLGIANPAKCAELEFANSVHMVALLTERIIQQSHSLGRSCNDVQRNRAVQYAEKAKAH